MCVLLTALTLISPLLLYLLILYFIFYILRIDYLVGWESSNFLEKINGLMIIVRIQRQRNNVDKATHSRIMR